MTRIGQHDYIVETLPVTTQFSLSALLSPVVSIMTLQEDRSELAKKFPQSFTALCGGMSPDDHKWILETCLSVVRRVDAGSPPMPVWVGGMPAFQDIGLTEMLQLVWLVVEHHRMLDFFAASRSALTDQPDGQKGSAGQGFRTAEAG
jgi:hypothetical protein